MPSDTKDVWDNAIFESFGGREAYDAALQIAKSYAKARAKHAPMRGPHEGYAVLLEEVDELWDEVKRWQPNDQNLVAMRKEALHVAAMALAFLIEVAPPQEVPNAE